MNKKKPKKFTFKNYEKATGRASVGAGTPSISIRYAGIDVGYITFNNSWNSNRELGIRIHFRVPKDPTTDNPCPWKWVFLTRQFVSKDEAKTYLNENFDKLSKMIFIEN
jgi:hypothetical protein